MPTDDDARTDQEGVRLLGADEAAEALERDDVAQRRRRDEPRFGDRPRSPEGPRPTIRFPLPADEAAEPLGRVRDDDTALPHWTDPPTGEVPRIFAAEDGDEVSPWASFATGQPRWRGEGDDYDDFEDFSRLADDETRVGALAAPDERPADEIFFGFEEDDDYPEPEPVPIGRRGAYDDDRVVGRAGARTRSISSDPRRSATRRAAAPAPGSPYERPSGAGRDLPLALGVAAAFGVIALICFRVGPVATIGLITVVLAVAGMELFRVLRQAGYQPATLLGLASIVALPLAAYHRAEAGIPLVLFLTVVFGLLWFLGGAGGEDRPVIGLSSTLLGVGWIGVLGSFAALMLVLPTTAADAGSVAEPGIGILLVAILGTIGYDVGGLAVGRNAGTRPLSAASPNKTIEGLVGGMVIAAVVAFVAAKVIAPFSEAEMLEVVLVALGVAVAAPLGDLCQSLVKRDLDVKDMGTLLPGHGGFLDRFDGLLFVLPVVYYLASAVLY